MRRSVLHLMVFLPILTAPGCVGESESAAEWDGTFRDSAGITIVENFGAPLWSEEDRWRLVEELRIGAVEGDPEYQFGRLSGFMRLSDGRVVAADVMAQRVRFYSPGGEHLQTVGTSGSGPKDFGNAWLSILVGPGDTLLVVDTQNQRVHRLSPDGKWLGQFSTLPENGRFVAGWDTDPSGTIISRHTPMQNPDTPAADSMDLVLVRDVRGEVLDTLGRVPTQRWIRFSGAEPERHYFAALPDFDLRWDGGLVMGRSDRYELSWYDADAELERIVRLRRDPAPFTEADRILLSERFEALIRRYDVPPENAARFRSTLHFEDHYPVFRRFMCGPQGTLWVQRVRPLTQLSAAALERVEGSPSPPGSEDWDVFDREGRYLGVVEVPEEFGLVLLARDRLLGAWRDELDVEHLVVMRIVGMPPEP